MRCSRPIRRARFTCAKKIPRSTFPCSTLRKRITTRDTPSAATCFGLRRSNRKRMENAKSSDFAWRKVGWLCVPALIVAAIIRIVMSRHLPLAYFNQDALGFLETTRGLLERDEFVVNRKRTLLVPLLYWLLSVINLPIALVIPLIQHALGCVMIAMFGVMGRLLFSTWKILVVLLTLLLAIDPNLLFYEHFLMAESLFLFFIVLMVAAGAWHVIARTWLSFGALVTSYFLAACTRPEGRLFLLFPLVLIALLNWRKWRLLAIQLAALGVTALVFSSLKSGNEGGLLLYTWIVHLTPDTLRSAPDFPPVIGDIKRSAADDWKKHDKRLSEMPVGWQFKKRREILHAVGAYLGTTSLPPDEQFRAANKFCTRVALETCLRRPFAVLFVGLKKGIGKIRDLTGGKLDRGVLQQKPANALDLQPDATKLLVGTDLRTPTEAEKFVRAHYPAQLKWFNSLYDHWRAALNALSIPRKDWKFAGATWPPIPLFYIASIAGLL